MLILAFAIILVLALAATVVFTVYVLGHRDDDHSLALLRAQLAAEQRIDSQTRQTLATMRQIARQAASIRER